LDGLAKNPGEVLTAQQAGIEWARAHTWDVMLPLYREELAQAADRGT
jgi:hypothetical protein